MLSMLLLDLSLSIYIFGRDNELVIWVSVRADDDPLVLKTVDKQLRHISSEGGSAPKYVSTLCSDPSEASRLLEDGYQFDLVLCDIYMPSIDGFALLDLVKNKVSSQTPVALMSSSAAESTRVRGLRAGAVSVLSKPIKTEHFRSLWQQVEQQRMQGQPSSPLEFQSRQQQEISSEEQAISSPSSADTFPGGARRGADASNTAENGTSVYGKSSITAGSSVLANVVKVLEDASNGRQPDRQMAQNAREAVRHGYLTGKPSTTLSSDEIKREYDVVTFLDALSPLEGKRSREEQHQTSSHVKHPEKGEEQADTHERAGNIKEQASTSKRTASIDFKQTSNSSRGSTSMDLPWHFMPVSNERSGPLKERGLNRFKFFRPADVPRANQESNSAPRPPDSREHFRYGEKKGSLIQGATASFGNVAKQIEALSSQLPPRERQRLAQQSNEVAAALLSAGRHLLNSSKLERIVDILHSLPSLDFDSFELDELTDNQTLMLLSPFFFVRYGLVDEFELDLGKLIGFTAAVDAAMPNENPYHNSSHIADVLQSIAAMIEGCITELFLTHDGRLHILTLLFSGIIHDFQHPGFTEDLLIQMEHEWALIHSEKSVLEKQHVSAGLQLLKEPQYNFMENLSVQQRHRLRKLAFTLVLGTDMKKHFKLVDKFSILLERYQQQSSESTTDETDKRMGYDDPTEKSAAKADALLCDAARNALQYKAKGPFSFDELEESDLTLVLRICMKVADLGHLRSPRDVHRRWTYSLLSEFWAQGDRERQMGLNPAAHMDRQQMQSERQVASSQLAFFDYIVLPMVQKWSMLAPGWCHGWLQRVNDNHAYWVALKEANEEERVNSVKIMCSSCGIALCRCKQQKQS